MKNRLSLVLTVDPEAYGIGRRYIIQFGMSDLAYGSTPEEAFANFQKRFLL